MNKGGGRGKRVDMTSSDLVRENISGLKKFFPEVATEGKVDFAKLRRILGDGVDDRAERYSFSWAGKRDAIRLLQIPSRATLVPAKGESINFDQTNNLFIEGENLEVLKLLYKSYAGRVKMIYIDPPYNTGADFIYSDNFADPLEKYLQLTGQKDTKGNLLTSNPETGGRYHSAWLSMMYPRLSYLRQLLREDGVIFVSIDDHEVHNLRMLMNEVFGEENFIGMFVWQSKKGGGSDKDGAVNDQEYVICFGKMKQPNSLSRMMIESEELNRNDGKGPYRRGRELNKWGANSRREDRPTMFFPIAGPNGEDVYPIRNDGAEGCWRWGKKKMFGIVEQGDVEFERRADGTYIVYEKIRSTDPRFKPFRTWLTDVGTTADGTKEVKALFDGKKVYDFPKPVPLIKHLVSLGTTGEDDLILDIFAGSCTTAQAVMELNREDEADRPFICVELPEPTPKDSEARKAGYNTITEIGRERIRRVISKMKKVNDGQLDLKTRETPEDLAFKGYRLAESNYRSWKGVKDKDGKKYAKTMEMFIDPLLPGWKPINVIYEVALKEGYSLICQIEVMKEIKGNTIYFVSDPDKNQSFQICLDDKLKESTLDGMKFGKNDLFICRDLALTDEQAANLALQCKLKTI